MATLSQGPRLNARTTSRIHMGIKQCALISSQRGLHFQGRDLSVECVISAILLEFLELNDQDQADFLKPALRKLEAELASF
jgi:hypothetical protein